MKPILTAVLLVAFASPALADAPTPVKFSVCGVARDGGRANYASAHAAQTAGAKVLHRGDCEAPGKEPMMCSMIYKPVCASEPAGGKEKTYPNLCHAEVANAPLLHDGACAGDSGG